MVFTRARKRDSGPMSNDLCTMLAIIDFMFKRRMNATGGVVYRFF